MGLCRLFSILMISCCLLDRSVHAQCQFDWQPSGGLPGVDGSVLAMTTWDPDGDGPAPEVLVLGGSFTIAGNANVSNIAIWDGFFWHGLAEGTNGTVNALTVWNNQLIVGGAFTLAGGIAAQKVAAWDGVAWRNLGAGFNYSVLALAVYQGSLLAGGLFDHTGSVTIDQLARWDGEFWSSLPGSQFTSIGGWSNPFVAAMTVFNDKLIIGGSFNFYIGESANIISWDGLTWTPLAGGDTSGPVYAMIAKGDYLYAGGAFSVAGSTNVEYVARWNGSSWSPVATNMEYYSNHYVQSLFIYNGQLVAGGNFVFGLFGQYYAGIAILYGSGWSPIGYKADINFGVRAFAIYGNRLIIGGGFSSVRNSSGELPVRGIIGWTGFSWYWLNDVSIGASHFLKVGQDLYANGALFVEHSPYKIWLAKWDGSTWVGPSECFYFNGGVSSMLLVGEDLYVSGNFTKACGTTVKFVAQWHDGAWTDLGEGLPSYPHVLAHFDGKIVAGGDYRVLCDEQTWICSGAVSAWTGTTWELLGGGVANQNYSPNVTSMIEWNDRLVVGGYFSSAGGKPANGIAAWDGQFWEPMDNGLSLTAQSYVYVRDLALWNGNLVASIDITDLVHIVGIWDGQRWNTLGQADGTISEFAVFDGGLTIGGDFGSVNGVSASKIARWKNGNWEGLGSGLDGSVYSLTSYEGSLLVGGSFGKAGDNFANGFARWSTGHSSGDTDCDGAVDLSDWMFTSFCLTGPLALIEEGCTPNDRDGDQDIDLWDLSKVMTQYLTGRQECVRSVECDDRAYCNGAERCVDYSCTEGDPPCESEYEAPVPCSDYLESCLYYSNVIDFDNAPCPQPDVVIADQYWDALFRSEGVSDSPVFKQDVYNNSSYFAFSNSAVFPLGFNIVVQFSSPGYFVIEADVMTMEGVVVTMIAKNANGTVIATTTSQSAPSSFWIGSLVLSADEPIASVEFWPSDPAAVVGIDNLIQWYP